MEEAIHFMKESVKVKVKVKDKAQGIPKCAATA